MDVAVLWRNFLEDVVWLTGSLTTSITNASYDEVKWAMVRALTEAQFALSRIHPMQPDPAFRMAKNLGVAASCDTPRSMVYNAKRHEARGGVDCGSRSMGCKQIPGCETCGGH